LPAVAYFAAVIGLLGLAQILPAPAYLVMDAVAFLAAEGWCAHNFWRCRQAHCLLTGSGWLLLALFAVTEAGLGHTTLGPGAARRDLPQHAMGAKEIVQGRRIRRATILSSGRSPSSEHGSPDHQFVSQRMSL
jgi:hypothetical protein